MRDIYLIDFENVASEGLSGITYLSEDDKVIIFYSNNSNRLTMKMHILIGKSVCQLEYFEVSVGGKNALDHQISTWLGYLIGTGAAERNYYIVSRDMGYKHVANFWAAKRLGPKVRCIDAIKGASRLERNRKAETLLQAVPVAEEAVPEAPAPFENEAAEPMSKEITACPLEPASGVESAEVVEPTGSAPAEFAEQTQAPEQTEVLKQAQATEQTQTPEQIEAPEQTQAPEQPQAPEQTEAPERTEVPEPEEMEALPAEAAIAPDVPAEEIQAEEAAEVQMPEQSEPPMQMQKRTYRSRSRVRKNRSRNYTYQERRDAASEIPEPGAEKLPEPAPEGVSAQPEAAPEVKKPDSGKKQTAKAGASKGKTAKKETEKPGGNLEQLSALIAPYPKLQENVLRDLIANNKRQVLCNTLRKHLGQEKGLALYNEIKRAAWH